MSVTAGPILEKQPGESILYCFDFTPLLAKTTAGVVTETLSGTPTVTATVSGLTIGSPVVNTAAVVKDDYSTVAIGCGVQVRISSGTDLVRYHLECTCGTTLNNTREVDGELQVIDQ